MSKPKPIRTLAEATELLVQHAAIEGQLAQIQARRNAGLARLNRVADAATAVLLAKLTPLQAQLEPWWQDNKAELAKGRKTATIGGCSIGYRKSRSGLVHNYQDDEKAVTALQDAKLGKQTLKVRYYLDRTATLALVDGTGKRAEQLKALGFSKREGEDAFTVARVEQASIGG